MIKAFLLTRQWFDSDNGVSLSLWFRSDDKAIQVEISNQQSIFFISQKDSQQVQNYLGRFKEVEIKPLELKTFDMQPVSAVYFQSQQTLFRARDILQKNGINCYESDIRPTERFLTERFITGPVRINTESHENTLFNPSLSPTDYHPNFVVMSIDIETDYSNDQLFSISFVSDDIKLTLMIGERKSTDLIHYVKNESELLKAFLRWVEKIDPDIFIGWNVINFDFRFLQKKFDQLNIKFKVGRNASEPHWRQARDNTGRHFLLIPGRVVLDGIDTLKSATYSFSSFSLENVGSELLQRGKLIHADPDNHDPLYKAKEIRRQFYEDKATLAAYNLEDCQLVWDIFEHTHLIDFAIERARLTGLEMDRMGGSVAAFDNLYLPRLHRKGFIAPNIGDSPGGLSAPGGYVMNSQPGFYDSVLVLDYKSLYPSIIRTFKVDPYGRIAAKQENESDVIPGYDGATFSRSENILPDIIKNLWQARDVAKKDKNAALSQAIKIIMNSFYGVLGTSGCRVHDSRLTSSITKRSHQIILETVSLIEREGYSVIYGDTDSVFVYLKKPCDQATADKIGNVLVDKINAYWKKKLKEKYNITSYLEMEYETHFIRFFMPTIRGSEKGSKKRYAGLIKDTNGQQKIIYKGLEAVRTDWTTLAKEFQQELYQRIFNGRPYEEFIRQTIESLKSGKCDEKLVYRKRLRQDLNDYVKNIPPHARAAIKAEHIFEKNGQPSRYKNASWIEYVITKNGPEVLECQQSPLDYEHYVEKQIVPIAGTILSAIGASIDSIVRNQIEMF